MVKLLSAKYAGLDGSFAQVDVEVELDGDLEAGRLLYEIGGRGFEVEGSDSFVERIRGEGIFEMSSDPVSGPKLDDEVKKGMEELFDEG